MSRIGSNHLTYTGGWRVVPFTEIGNTENESGFYFFFDLFFGGGRWSVVREL